MKKPRYEYEAGRSFGSIILIISLVFFFLAVLLGGLFFLLRSSGKVANTNETPNINTATINQNVAVPIPEAADTDQDGLSDEQERNGGTDPFVSDTDQDGLTDREEVRTFLTDPLIKDTDADGFSDGQEIQRGYNPKGPGKLFNFEQGLKNLNQP